MHVLTAPFLGFIHAALYVGVLYIFPSTRPSPALPRDAIPVIRNRIRAATIATGTSLLLTYLLLSSSSSLGLYPHVFTAIDVGKALALTAVLFAAPLTLRAFNGDLREMVEFASSGSWQAYRNFVAAPVTEELVFRAALVPVFLESGWTPTQTVFISPLVFGIAHAHHAYEFLLNRPGAYIPLVIRTIFQFSYTTIFGWFAVFLYLRTGSVWVPVIVHAFCNFIGVPELSVRRASVCINALYWAGLLAGAWIFKALFWSLTESEGRMAEF